MPAAYDVTASGGRRIGLARLDWSGSVTAQVDAPGSEGGKYPQLAMLDASTAILAWTTGNDEGPEARLARVTLR